MFRSKSSTNTRRSAVAVISFSVVMLFMVPISCTDLDQTVNSQLTEETLIQNESQINSVLASAYAILGDGGDGFDGDGGFGSHNTYVSVQEIATDEMLIPHRGPDWQDGRNWVRIHMHEFDTDIPPINNAWILLFRGVTTINSIIPTFDAAATNGVITQQEADSFKAELRVLRAYFYLQLLDAFGNVPIVTEDTEEELPANNANFETGRQELFAFVENSVLNNLDNLSEDASATRGRINRWVGHMILAKLYLNAEVYTGTARWDDVITQTDAIINSGNYSLATSYSSNFSATNSDSPEHIFTIPYDEVFLTGFNVHQMSLHYGMQATFQMVQQPWNGYATLSEFYNTYTDPTLNPGPQGTTYADDGSETIGTQDDRLSNFLVGPQFDAEGDDPITDPDYAVTNTTEDEQRGTVDQSPELVLTPRIDELEPSANRQSGARIGKYEIPLGQDRELSNDFVIYRYADVLLMKAEALWRGDPGSGEALNLVNQIRQRAGVDDFGSLSAEQLLAERGREFFYEILRRQDLLRFDGVNGGTTRFNDPWEFKGVTPDNVKVFPIPQDQIEANPNLTQNPGF